VAAACRLAESMASHASRWAALRFLLNGHFIKAFCVIWIIATRFVTGACLDPMLDCYFVWWKVAFVACNLHAPGISSVQAPGKSLYVSRIFPANCGAEKFAQRANPKLFLRARAVSLHGFQTQMQILGNLRGRASLSKEPEYFQLAIT
jgi:hypothetical protein